MRYLFGIVAAMFVMVGVASAADTGFGDWGTAAYDQVMDGYTINYSSYFSPEPAVNSMSSSSAASSSSSSCGCSWSSAGHSYDYSYNYGPVEYGDDDWDWYTP